MQRRPRNPLALFTFSSTLLAHALLLLVETQDFVPVWASELARFIPFYWVLPPLVLGALAAFWLRPRGLLLALGLGNVLVFGLITMDWHWNSPPEAVSTGKHIRILSYNVKALNAEHKPMGLQQLEQTIQSYAPDLVALQDAQKWLTHDPRRSAPPEDENSNAAWVDHSLPVFGLPYSVAVGQFVIASRFPLEACEASPTDEAKEALPYLRCRALVDGKPLEIITSHLVSPRSGLLAAKTETSSGLVYWQHNVARRLQQSQALLRLITQRPGPVVVLGDFNAAEQSPVIENLKLAQLHDAFSEAGRGWGYTHGHALNQGIDLYRIDHILLSPSLRALHFEVGNSQASEHNPIVADVVLQ